jgi:hypothetical protein
MDHSGNPEFIQAIGAIAGENKSYFSRLVWLIIFIPERCLVYRQLLKIAGGSLKGELNGPFQNPKPGIYF